MRKSKRSAPVKGLVSEIVTLEADDTTCSVCYAEFLDRADLDVHIQQMHPPGRLVNCQFCEKILPNAEAYALHVRDGHLIDLKSCLYCCRVFTKMSSFKKHRAKHTLSMPDNKVSCSQCDYITTCTDQLCEHEFVEHSNGEGVFLNEYYALLSSVLNIKADSVIRAIGKDFIYICSQCKHFDADLGGYISHLKLNNCRSLVCDRCYKVFVKKRSLVEHLAKNCKSDNLLKQPAARKCNHCLKSFDLKTLKQHVKSCTMIKCSKCNVVFDTMYHLTEHQSQEHSMAVLLVVCTFCRKECVGKIALDKHIDRVHGHELHLYKYTCSYCDATFKHPQRLFAHYFTKHKDIEPYKCNICNEKFRIRKKFTLHIKLVHNSNGFVEFDEKLHVFFTSERPEKPFQPVSKYTAAKTCTSESQLDKSVAIHKSDDLHLANVNSDFMNPTETEGNQTDVNQDATQRKRKRKTRSKNKLSILKEMEKLTDDGDSDDEPLVTVRKKAKIKSELRRRDLQWTKKKHTKPFKNQNRFTCKICKQYCYTFQNYHNHVSMHFKDETKRCVKCSLSFKTKADLQRHLEEEHASSKLTETLKSLLDRRKKGEEKVELTMTEKFLKTIKKVEYERDDVTATVTPITKELSVQKFIENFTPEVNENKAIQIKDDFSFSKVVAPKREPLIKMKKFTPAPAIIEANIKLAMPVQFKKVIEKHSVTIKKVEVQPFESEIKLRYEEEVGNDDYQEDYDDDYYVPENKEAYIPEAEQEVTLEGTDEAPKRKAATHRIVIPKLPKELKTLRIAHLLPEAPYYKIVKMDDIMLAPAKVVPEAPVVKSDVPVQLPDGTTLVHVNPLAHLLGDTPIEKLIRSNSKYYKPKNRNFKDALAKALQKLDNPVRPFSRKKTSKTKSKQEVEEKQDTSQIELTDKELITEDKPTGESLPELETGDDKESPSQAGIENAANVPECNDAEV